MLLRCTTPFETREGASPRTIDEGTVWYMATQRHPLGGYEVAVLERVDGGAWTGDIAMVRLEMLSPSIGLFELVPLSECPEPIGCSTLNNVFSRQ